MKIHDEIKNLNDEELEDYVSKRIMELEKESYDYNSSLDIIGYDLDYNPRPSNVLGVNEHERESISVRCMYVGYVRKNIKMIYGVAKNPKNGFISNHGYYYVIDTDDYVYEFCNYIKDKELDSEFDLFLYLQKFIFNYFRSDKIDDIDRETLFMMISKNPDYMYSPVIEHKFSKFKGMGAAVCTEIALVANNIINFFGINSYLIVGEMVDEGEKGAHAYNIINYDNSTTGKKEASIIDFAAYVNIYNLQGKVIGAAPYMTDIENFDEEFIDEFIGNKLYLTDDKHIYLHTKSDNFMVKFALENQKRDYYVGGDITLKRLVK